MGPGGHFTSKDKTFYLHCHANPIASHVTFSVGVHGTRVLPTMSCIVVHVIHICSSYTCIGTRMSIHDVRAIQ